MTDITLTPEQEEEVVKKWLTWIIENECGSHHEEDIESWREMQEAAKVLLWPITK